MAERCPDCGRLKYDSEHDDFCEVYTELRDARADYRRRIASLEAAVAAADEMRKFLPVTKTAPLARWTERFDAAKAELERVKG